MGFVDVVVMTLFMVAVIAVGLYKSKAMDKPGGGGETAEDYFLAGRGLSWWLIGFSLIAANISAEGSGAKISIGIVLDPFINFTL